MKNLFKHPYMHSLMAEAYIVILVAVMNLFAQPNTPDTFFDSIVAISLFVLSAAVMGYLFLSEPIQLYVNGEKKKAISFFLQTVSGFAVITLLATIVLAFV